MIVCRHMPPAPGCQRGPVWWVRSAVSSLHSLPAVGRQIDRGVLGAGVHRVGVVQRRLEMPDALELPRPRRAVVPEVLADLALVGEVVADRIQRLAAVVGPLDHLPEPALTTETRTTDPDRPVIR